MNSLFLLVPLASLFALGFAYFFFHQMMKESEGTVTMKKIARHVRDGAMAYLRQQYKVVTYVFIGLTVLFAVMAYVLKIQNPWVPFAFLTGGLFLGWLDSLECVQQRMHLLAQQILLCAL